jgi:hypothetical protein
MKQHTQIVCLSLSLPYMSLTTHADPYEATLSLLLVMGRSPATAAASSLSADGRRGLLHEATGRWARATPQRAQATPPWETTFFLLLQNDLIPPARWPSSCASCRVAAGSRPRATQGSPAAQRRWSSTRSRRTRGPCRSWAHMSTWHRRSSAVRAMAAPLTGRHCNGSTPFKGSGNRATLCNGIEQPLWFPSDGGRPAAASAGAWDLIDILLVKEPQKRITFTRGATTFFLFWKINLWCRLVTADTTNDSFFVSLGWYRLGLTDTTNVLPADTKSPFCSSDIHAIHHL